MIKLIHCSDVRFDMSLKLPSASMAAVRREDMKSSFDSLLKYARENEINLVLISGNLFDGKNISRQTLEYLIGAFQSCPECEFVISPGKDEGGASCPVYQNVDFPENVSIFKSAEISSFDFDFDGEKVKVYGQAYADPSYFASETEKLRCGSSDAINILVSPYGVEALSDKARSLSQTGIDYAALREGTGSCGIFDEGDMWYSYAGVLEMLCFEDTPDGGFALVEAQKKNNEFICKPRLVNTVKKRCLVRRLAISGAVSEEDVINATARFFSENREIGENALLRLVYTGDVLPQLILPEKKIKSMAKEKNFFYFEIIDETVPLYNYEQLSEDPTIKGALFNAFRPQICSSDPEVRSKAANAFRVGMVALEGKYAAPSANGEE